MFEAYSVQPRSAPPSWIHIQGVGGPTLTFVCSSDEQNVSRLACGHPIVGGAVWPYRDYRGRASASGCNRRQSVR
jgi:hypothetical protein